MLRPGQALAEAFKRALDFKGRSRRSAYWWFALFLFLGGAAIGIVDDHIKIPSLETWPVFFMLFNAIVILPDLTLGLRRFHDTNRSGWLYVVWILLSYGTVFLPKPDYEGYDVATIALRPWTLEGYELVYGFILPVFAFLLMLVMIFFLSRDSQKGINKYAPNPKGIGNIDVFE